MQFAPEFKSLAMRTLHQLTPMKTITHPSMKTIDLREYTSGGRFFGNRSRAALIRAECGVVAGDPVKVIIPDDCYCILRGFWYVLLDGVEEFELVGPEHLVDDGIEKLNDRTRLALLAQAPLIPRTQ